MRVLSAKCRDYSKLSAIGWWFGASIGRRSLPVENSARVPQPGRERPPSAARRLVLAAAPGSLTPRLRVYISTSMCTASFPSNHAN